MGTPSCDFYIQYSDKEKLPHSIIKHWYFPLVNLYFKLTTDVV